ncbi:MAG: exodeoxyribonuclease VII small subunit [Proteobacteria bacterium]|nr:exodeoxyribonuclease VII small subunit [Pseudomonadota bacterium]
MTKKKESFEDVLENLEKIVHSLENGDLPLEEALEHFEKGVRLSRECATRLDAVQRRIEEILEDGSTKPLHPDNVAK